MLKFLRTIFRKTPPAAPGSMPEERWQADFSSLPASRFQASSDPRYGVAAADGRLGLTLRKSGLFAWSDAQLYRYGDFSAEALLSFPETGDCAAGLVLRSSDDSSFAYFLVSPDGYAQMDLVFNGSPRSLVPRLECPWIRGQEAVLVNVVARGPRYLLLLDGRWAFEAEDDTLEAGRLGFAARSGQREPAGAFSLSGLSVESRPIEVEVEYLRFARVLEADGDQRRRLATAHFGAGDWLPALMHLRKLCSREPVLASDRFLEAECCLRLDLLDEAELALSRCLELDPSHEEAREERYNLLYLRGRYPELRAALEADAARAENSPRLLNLLGHARFNMGAWEPAADAYGAAAALEPGMPIYALNQARALERAERTADAAVAWLDAARGFFAQEAWDDARACSVRLRELKFDPAALDSIDARIALATGRRDEAERMLARLAKKRADDAPAAFAWGTILAEKGRRGEALAAFRRAVELDPEDARYRPKLAEMIFLDGGDCREELRLALEAYPDDGWTLNLAGQEALSRGDRAAAIGYFRRAAEALPDAAEPAINLSDALAADGRLGDAGQALARAANSAPVANQRGNLAAAAGDLKLAIDAYREAVSLAKPGDPSRAEYLANLAAAQIESGLWAEAETALRHALDIGQDARSLALMGDVAEYFGEYARAEAAYRLAQELDPEGTGILLRLARHYLSRGRWADASAWANRLVKADPENAAQILAAVRAATEQSLSCASCGRAWTLPKPTPASPRSALRGEPPDDCPAGSCPSCGLIYCVSCRKPDLAEGRFTCAACGARLSLNDDRVRWLVREAVKERR